MSYIFEKKEIEYQVTRRKRKTLAIHIEPSGAINVYAPFKCSVQYIQSVVEKKASWISKKLTNIKEMSYMREYNKVLHGEEALYLGKNYSLDIIEDTKIKRPKVTICEDKLCITIRESDKDKVKEILQKWYIQKANENIEERVIHYSQLFKRKPVLIKIRSAKRRWGSCSTKGNINFNWKCIFTHQEVIDYVVVHEMCHLIHMDHSKKFWQCVEAVLPDYRERKVWLKKYGNCLDF